MLWSKKNSYKDFDKEKKIPAAWKFPSPAPHNFSNGPSLNLSPLNFMEWDRQKQIAPLTYMLLSTSQRKRNDAPF